ncbi:RcpC/CpaB family pilus assembly protein [Streptomyces fradiae]|uniref:RcpC/CpaB family pilus assembly protein n=1 Tax=Streptomyces fradiae TaxID=1906 RepID=UPI002942247D|nr:RcpC/CpaB family pilus assembly protein [Streptomyces fradiae]WOI58967.1 RcpC/CpaB family pilus assembly protein [Streptomyces fradiae]
MAAGLAMTAAALAASGLREPVPEVGPEARRAVGAVAVAGGSPGAAEKPARSASEVVSAPVRIADGATVRLLRPGDRVDVIAAPDTPAGSSAEGGGPQARVVVSGARVAAVPRAESAGGAGRPHLPEGEYPHLPEGEGDPPDGVDAVDGAGWSGGALLVLAVPRAAAPGLVAASATSRLAVVLC